MAKDTTDCKTWFLSTRFWLAVLTAISVFLIYSQATSLSVTLVCMVNHTYLISQHMEFNYDERLLLNVSSDKILVPVERPKNIKDGPFNWPKTKQGHILGAFYYGYLVSHIPAGILTHRYGPKWVYTLFYLLSALSTLLTPVAARAHYGWLIFVRVLTGIGGGSTFSAMYTLYGTWAPSSERSKLLAITYSGFYINNILSPPLSGVLCVHGFDGGWPSIFYILGCLSLMWLVLWILLGANTPQECRCISLREQSYINEGLEEQLSQQHIQKEIPWRSIMTSLPVWAIIISNITYDWFIYTVLTITPTYMNEVLKLDIQQNGLYSALPYIGMWMGVIGWSILADKLISSHVLTVGTTRKFMNSIGSFGPAMLMIPLGFIGSSIPFVGVIILTLALIPCAATSCGYIVNSLDISPQFAGVIMGISNSVGAITGFLAPYTAEVLTVNQTREEWQVVFLITAAIASVGGVFFVNFASGDLQPWSKKRIRKSSETDALFMDNSGYSYIEETAKRISDRN